MLQKMVLLMRLLGPKFKDAWPLIVALLEIFIPASAREAGRIMGAAEAAPVSPEMQELMTGAEQVGLDPVEVRHFAMLIQEREGMVI